MPSQQNLPRLQWHRIDNESWLTGSIRSDLTIEQRSVWADLLCIAGKSKRPGYIEETEDKGYEITWLATYLRLPLELLQSTIDACTNEGRIETNGTGVLHITNWDRYQYVPDDKKKSTLTDDQREFLERAKLSELAHKFPGDTIKHKIKARATRVRHYDQETGVRLESTDPAVIEAVYTRDHGKAEPDDAIPDQSPKV